MSQKTALTSWLAQDDLAEAIDKMRRFDILIKTTPSLRAYQLDMTDQLVAVAAGLLAARAGVSADEPEPQIAATALVSLWTVQFKLMGKHLAGTPTAAQRRGQARGPAPGKRAWPVRIGRI